MSKRNPHPGGTTQRNPHQEAERFWDGTPEEATPEEGKREEKDAEGAAELQERQEGKRRRNEENTRGGSAPFIEEKPEPSQRLDTEQSRETKLDSNANQQRERDTTVQPSHVLGGKWLNQRARRVTAVGTRSGSKAYRARVATALLQQRKPEKESENAPLDAREPKLSVHA
ncbi:hypothetical protein NDU88_002427 [Pleurodeles waltl]|uniref:Uncharacterized protein n=1 Tax=Pleurodeles waltl TaxID=8319 RepID=A0AAV7U9P5_PLEWA|nr:hypothetical protein NDU88_002427 [Pleurodeles waltl]